METVNVTLEGVQGEPLGHVDTRVMDVTVTAAYTSAVVLADGTIIPPVIAEKILGSNGKTSFTVYGSDSSEVNELYHGFGVRFTARVRYARGQAGPTYQRTVKVPAGGPHDLGSLPAAEPFTPDEWKNIEDVAAPIRDAAEAAALDASNAADSAQQSATASQTSADAAAQAAADAQQAMQAQFATQDEGVADLITTSAGPLTRAALDDRYRTALLATARGAVGDDTTDDTTALQAAIDSAAAIGVPLDLQGLTYWCSDGITLPAGVTLRDGNIRSTGSTTGLTGVVTVIGDGVTLVDVSLEAGTSAYYGLHAEGVSGLTIRRGTWTGAFTAAIGLHDAADVAIEAPTLTGIARGIRVRDTCRRVTITGARVTQWTAYGIEVRGESGIGAPEDVTIDGLIAADPIAGDTSKQAVATFGADDARIQRLTIRRSAAIGPGLPRISGGTDAATGDQFGVQYVDQLVMESVVSIGGGENGISVTRSVHGATLTNLHVVGADGHGLQIGRHPSPPAVDPETQHARDVTVSGGTFLDNGINAASEIIDDRLAGVYVQGADRISITGVRSGATDTGAQPWGIMVANTVNATVTSCDLTGNYLGRIETNDSSYDQLIDGDTITLGSGVGATSLALNGGDGTRRQLEYQADGVAQWRWVQNSANHMTVERVDTGGTALNVLQIYHSDGSMWVRQGLRVTGKIGFDNKVPIDPPSVSAGASVADVITALKSLGLFR